MKTPAVIRTATILLAVSFWAAHGQCQQTTDTTCLQAGTGAVNCNSTTTDYGAYYRQGQQVGQAIGAPIGQAIYMARQRHAFSKGIKKYCAAHPGQDWHYYSRRDGHVLSSGHCPSDEDKVVAAANEFMAHHKDFKPCDANSKVMVAYIETHNLDPREQKSYERAYKALRKTGQLELYKKE